MGEGAACVRVREKSGRTFKIFGLIEEEDRVAHLLQYEEGYWGKSRVVWEAGINISVLAKLSLRCILDIHMEISHR